MLIMNGALFLTVMGGIAQSSVTLWHATFCFDMPVNTDTTSLTLNTAFIKIPPSSDDLMETTQDESKLFNDVTIHPEERAHIANFPCHNDHQLMKHLLWHDTCHLLSTIPTPKSLILSCDKMHIF